MNVVKLILKIFGIAILVFALIVGFCALINAISERKNKHT